MLLRGEGYENLLSTTDPSQALDLIAEKRPDLVLLNLIMPKIGGLEILGAMRNDEAFADVPVIIMTSSTDPDMKLRAMQLGATDFLAKPVDPSELALRLRNVLAIEAYQDCPDTPRKKRSRPGLPVVSRLAGRDPRFRAISERFAVRLEAKLEAMEASWEDGDFEELADLAHWLKGAAGTVGFDAFTAPADTLRLLAKERKRDDIPGAIRELRALAERIAISNWDSGA